jgi:hypothetical protein
MRGKPDWSLYVPPSRFLASSWGIDVGVSRAVRFPRRQSREAPAALLRAEKRETPVRATAQR